jgi:glucokinase
MSKKDVTIGIDIGGTNTKIGIVDIEGNCPAATSIQTLCEDASLFLPRLYQAIDLMWQPFAANYTLRGIGIGVPNGNYYTGTVEKPTNLCWAEVTPLASLIEEQYRIPVVLTNDANAAALGEMMFGAAKGMKNFIVITLGTGLGSGFIVNGDLVYGADGFAGEMGHIMVHTDEGRHCGCGRRGCLETYVSATGICRTVYKLLADHREDSELRKVSYNNLTASMITDAALRGDRIAIEAFEYTGRILGIKLADVVALFSPEAIILFGGLTMAREHLFEPTQRYMEQYMMPIFKNKVKLVSSGLTGANTAILGASALIWKELVKRGLLTLA